MKILFTLLFVAVAGSGFSQTNKIILPLLTAADGSVLLTNATFGSVRGKRVTFWTEAGAPKAFDVSAISQTNLQTLNIDPAAIKETAPTPRPAVTLRPPGEPKLITITLLMRSMGFRECRVDTPEGSETILIRLPPATEKYFSEDDRLMKEAARLEEETEKAAKAYEYLLFHRTKFSGSYEFVRASVDAEEAKIDRLQYESLSKTRDLKKTKSDWAFHLKLRPMYDRFMARNTFQKYGQQDIWEYVGPAPSASSKAFADR